MGFSLEIFFAELIDKVKNCKSHAELLDYIEYMKQYAKDCGQLHE